MLVKYYVVIKNDGYKKSDGYKIQKIFFKL